MDLQKLVRDVIPDECGVHRAYGKIAEMILLAEAENRELFPASDFSNARERMSLLMPYVPAKGCEDRYAFWLDVLTLAAIQHERKAHSGETMRYGAQDVASISDESVQRNFSPVVIEAATQINSWWIA